MKIISTILLFIVLIPHHSNAQRYRRQYLLTMLGGGYNQVNVNADGLNFVIDKFNESRRLVGDQAMKNIQTVTGFSGFLGTYGYFGEKSFFLEFRYGGAGQNLRATERLAGRPPIEYDLRFDMHHIQLGFGLMATSTPYFGIGLGFAPDLGIQIVNDKTGGGSTEIINNFNSGVSFLLPVYALLGPIMLGVRPYYTLQLSNSDYTELNARLNPATFANSPADTQVSRFNHFGIEFRVGLLLNKRERR